MGYELLNAMGNYSLQENCHRNESKHLSLHTNGILKVLLSFSLRTHEFGTKASSNKTAKQTGQKLLHGLLSPAFPCLLHSVPLLHHASFSPNSIQIQPNRGSSKIFIYIIYLFILLCYRVRKEGRQECGCFVQF